MDLKYQAQGDNKSRLRLIEQTLGSSADFHAMDTSTSVFSIWCGDQPPAEHVKIWWKDSSLPTIDAMIEYSKKQMSKHRNIDIMILEHDTHNAKENLKWFVVVSKDNVVRTFQNDTDVCSYLKEMAARHLTK